MLGLIANIRQLQSLKGLSDTQFARELGIDLSTWSKIKHGHRPPGGKFLKALARTYPELRLAVFEYMSSGDGEDISTPLPERTESQIKV